MEILLAAIVIAATITGAALIGGLSEWWVERK